MEFFGVRLIGVNAIVGEKLLLTLVLVIVLQVLAVIIRAFTRVTLRTRDLGRIRFWNRQAIKLITTGLLIIGVASIWFDNPTNLGIAAGLITAGLAFALQKVILALAGYFVILSGNAFRVGDRISMGTVRGDVISLDFLFTSVMEMGEPSLGTDAPATWVMGRQYTGRITTFSNAQIFDSPIFNYSREFPYIWDEIHVPITYTADRQAAERILIAGAEKSTAELQSMSQGVASAITDKYGIPFEDLKPRVFYRITDNWLELGLRFLAAERGIRDLKDRMSREILKGFDEAGIGIASTTYDIVGFPPVRVIPQGENA